MHAGERYSLKDFVLWTRRDSYAHFVTAAVPTLLYEVFDVRWLGLPWGGALSGTGAAFIVGFRNNATDAR